MSHALALAPAPAPAAPAAGQLAPLRRPPAADRHPAAVYLARMGSHQSRRSMEASLRLIAELLSGGRADVWSLPWARLRYQHTAALRAELSLRYAPATANRHLAALRGVLREAWRLGLIEAADFHRAADIPGVRGERLPAGRALERGELAALFAACRADRRPQGARDAALLAVLYGAGLRRAEAAALALADYEPKAGALTVRGKGNRERLAYVPEGGRAALAAWLAIRGSEPGALFVPVDKAGRLDPERRPLTGSAIFDRLRRRAAQAGVAAFSPHDLRRTFIGDHLDAGTDVVTVQRLAGHRDVSTTARYDRRPEAQKQRAAEAISVPYAAGG